MRRWTEFLLSRKHDVRILSDDPSADRHLEPFVERIRFKRLPKPLRYLLAVIQLRLLISRLQPDAIHIQSLGSNAVLAAAVPRGRLVISPWGGDIAAALRQRIRRRLVSAALRRSALVLTTSRDMARTLQDLGTDPSRIRTVSWGVDVERYRPADSAERSAAREALGLPREGLIATSIRSAAPVYRTLEIVRAFAKIPPGNDQLHLVVVAGFTSSDRRAAMGQRAYWQQVRAASQSDVRASRITLIDRALTTDEFASLLRATDLAISIPRTDQRATTVMEALAAGSSLVVAPIAPYAELQQEGYHLTILGEPIETALTGVFLEPRVLNADEQRSNFERIRRTEARDERYAEIEFAILSATD